MGRNKVAYQFQLATFLISDSTSLWWVVVCKPISVLSFAQAEQFHVLKFGLSESKIIKTNFFGGEGEKSFLWEHFIYLLSQGKMNTIWRNLLKKIQHRKIKVRIFLYFKHFHGVTDGKNLHQSIHSLSSPSRGPNIGSSKSRTYYLIFQISFQIFFGANGLPILL